ncbi:MAG: NAD-binding protein [Anaerolineae bacterium]|nr:NAD-binding protein [Anaerolineae bacterium]MCB9129764.1 NAD-binding protein [Anaerolineales bacterium]MCB0230005.1 NAD-binding protein [Anaerolineae bacterium]MCB0232706.1 NAD-binding protein [Anaerolineae bacterium]MCB0238706.1 NAD-binding protein [Anaerolineae bacterium]
MLIIVAGGGRTGTQLASQLLAQDHEVHIVENRAEILAHMHFEVPTEAIFEGFPTEPRILEAAGIAHADVVAATTDNDADNLAICFLARAKYNVGRTVARINNPRDAWLFDDTFHVDVAINQADLMASLIAEQMSLGDMMTLLKLRRGRYSLVEEKIPPGALAIGQAIRDVKFPEQCVIAAIIRNGEIVVPSGATTFEVADEVLAVTDPPGAQQLAAMFAPRK